MLRDLSPLGSGAPPRALSRPQAHDPKPDPKPKDATTHAKETRRQRRERYGITQEELLVYRIADTTAKQHERDRSRLRESLMTRLDAGASVEPGDLTATIITTERAGYEVAAGTVRSFKVLDTATLVPSLATA